MRYSLRKALQYTSPGDAKGHDWLARWFVSSRPLAVEVPRACEKAAPAKVAAPAVFNDNMAVALPLRSKLPPLPPPPALAVNMPTSVAASPLLPPP